MDEKTDDKQKNDAHVHEDDTHACVRDSEDACLDNAINGDTSHDATSDTDTPSDASASHDTTSDAGTPSDASASHDTTSKRSWSRRRKASVIVALLVIVLAFVFSLFWAGVLAPPNSAAKYNGFNYIAEQEVTDYITNYRNQMGYGESGDSSDETWASFLADNNLTPSILREATIHQLIIDKVVEQKAAADGIEASDEEVDNYLETMKNNLAFGDDEIWQKTLSMYGRTEKDMRDMYRHEILKTKLENAEVPMPEASDEQAAELVKAAYPEDTVAKHIYYLTVDGLDENGSYDKIGNVQKIRKKLIADGLTKKNFSAYVQLFCSDDDVKETGGAYGWDLDISDESEKFQEAVENLDEGGISAVFSEDNGYSFVWIDTTFTLSDAKDGDDYDMDKFPESLHQYFLDTTAYSQWQSDCETYLKNLYPDSNPTIYPMPADVPYNVDMSLVESQTDASASASDALDMASDMDARGSTGSDVNVDEE